MLPQFEVGVPRLLIVAWQEPVGAVTVMLAGQVIAKGSGVLTVMVCVQEAV